METSPSQKKRGVLFVCMANICRSPTAEAMFRVKAEKAGIAGQLLIDSAGTHDYRLGSPPDNRAQTAALRRGYDLSTIRARQVGRQDLLSNQYILAMDMNNLSALHRLGEPDLWQKPKLMMSYSRRYQVREVPDPFSGGDEGFELVLDMLESATEGLLSVIKKDL